jgi:hypothetical protein
MREFITTEFEFSHGKKPRGLGYWYFKPADNAWPGDSMPTGGFFWHFGTYAEAKKAVSAAWPAVTYWKVLP